MPVLRLVKYNKATITLNVKRMAKASKRWFYK